MSEANKALINRFIEEVLNNKNLAAADEIVPDAFVELDPLLADGDKVVTRFTWRGTHRGEFMGVPPIGRQVAVKGVVIDRIVGGEWKDSRLLMDDLGLMRQLGVAPAP
jgi:predicted ester cyclase